MALTHKVFAGPPVIWNGVDAKFINSGSIIVPGVGSAGICKADGTGKFSTGTVDLTSNVNGTLPISSGGTGQTTANAALNALLPGQGSSAGYFLTTDGSNSSWAAVAGGTMPSASSTSLVSTTSATTTFVTAITTSITVTATSAPVVAECVLDMTSATAASVATTRVMINGVSGGSVTESLTTATTQHLTVPNQNRQAALGPGTYTVNCDFNRASGTGTVTIAQGSLKAVALQGASTNGITQLTGALQAGPGSGSQVLSGVLPIANGGTNSSSAAVNGAVIYSTATAHAYTAAGSTGQLLRSAGAASPTWTTATFPVTTTINQLLYSSAANVIAGLATANTSALVTSSTGVPSLTSGGTANRLLRTNGTAVTFAQANLTTDVTGTLPFGNGGTGATTLATGRVPFSNGTALVTDPLFLYDTTNTRFTVGTGGGSGKVNVTVPSGSDLGLQAMCQGTNNCVQIRNQAAYNLAMLNANDANVLGVLVGAERSRGTQTSRTQALSGDLQLNLVNSCYTGSGSSAGFSSRIRAELSENCTGSANGGELAFFTTPNGATADVEHLRIKNSGETVLLNSHFKSTQTTPPVATVQAAAGTGSTCTIANSTDNAGQITITTGTLSISTGSYCSLAFNQTYGVAPICMLTPAGSALSTSVYVTSSTTALNVNFAVAGGITTAYVMNYHCIETQ